MPTPSPLTEDFAVLGAIDWADRKHVWKIYLPDAKCTESGELEHRPEAVEAWLLALLRRFPGRRVALALEQKNGPLSYMLTKYAAVVLFPIHPKSLSDYRKCFAPSGDKSDARDVDLILDLLRHHRDRLRPLQLEDAETRTLALLCEQRRNLVDQRTAFTNQLSSNLKLYFPQILDWFPDLDSELVAAVLRRWPTLAELKTARPATLERFFADHNCRSAELNQRRIAEISRAVPALEDPAVLESCRRLTPTLLSMIAVLREANSQLDSRIAELFQQHPDRLIFASLPRAGAALAPRLLVAFGTDRNRFASADALASYSGIAPILKQSGKTCLVLARIACPKFLRQTFHEFAAVSLPGSDWALQHYQQQRQSGKGHHTAIRSVARKWIRVIYACWSNNAPYDPELHRRDRERRRASQPAKAAL